MVELADVILDLPAAFGYGFVAGFLMCAVVYAIKAAVKLFLRIIK